MPAFLGLAAFCGAALRWGRALRKLLAFVLLARTALFLCNARQQPVGNLATAMGVRSGTIRQNSRDTCEHESV